MEQNLQTVIELVNNNIHLSKEEKTAFIAALKQVDKKITITEFKLERTEKVKHTTSTLLEETIQELEQKRKAVELQNRELEIEGSLERVRAVAMGMMKAEDLLSICEVLYRELQALGFDELRNTMIDIHYDAKACLLNYDYSEASGKTITKVGYNSNPFVNNLVKQIAASNEAFAEMSYSGEALNEWRAFRKSNGENDDPRLDNTEALYYHFYSIGVGDIGISTFKKITEEQLLILKRFRNVFDLAYKRYVDITNAEAQAREGQVQLALERARTQSMIMQHSRELDDTLRVFHGQILLLGIKSAFSFLWLPNEENERHVFWAAWAESNAEAFNSKAINYPLDKNEPATAQCLIDWKGSEPVVSYHVPPSGVESYFAAWRELIDGVEQLKPVYFDKGLYYVEAFMKYGCFGVISGSDLAEDEKKILNRFAVEFERAYTRFLDLQKAETQAREAQIELSLERVRAKTMAMHNSADVGETAAAMVDELKKLGVETMRCGIGIMHEPGAMEVWTVKTSGDGKTDMIIGWLDMHLHPLLDGAFESWRNKNGYYFYDLRGEDLLNYYNALNNYPGYPIKYEVDSLPDQIYDNEFHFAEGTLFAFSLQQLTGEQKKIFKRFAGVFGQTYRRYLDLKNAEAQAREAKIEAALERVRSRSLAMHRSGELKEVMAVMFQRLTELDVLLGTVAIQLFDPVTKDCSFWIGNDKQDPEMINLPYDENILSEENYMKDYWRARKSGKSFFNKVYSLEQKNKFFQYVFANNDEFTIPAPVRDFIIKAPSHVNTLIIENNSALFADNYDNQFYAEDQINVLKRTAKVFDQAYVRFLDLQKAEAQAREAQIEAALERVRGMAMSMMAPGDLMHICEAVFAQLTALGFSNMRAAQIYIRNDEQEEFINYDYSDDTGADVVNVKYNSHANTKRIYDVISTAGDALVDNMIHKKELEEWRNYLYNTLKQPYEEKLGNATELHYYLYSFGKGAFGICNFASLNSEDLGILKRFRNVFSFSYKRYNDISLAEAQAREARVEAALERVRSRTLAMQTSGELAQTAAVLFKQLIGLGIAPNRLYIGVIHDNSGKIEFWITDEDGSKVSTMFTGDAYQNPSIKKMFDGWAQQQRSIMIDMQGKELAEYFHYLGEELHVPFKDGLSQKRRWQYIAYFSKGFIGMASPDEQPKETVDLLERFALVFNLTFTRFNDLKVAEAHALQAAQDLLQIKAARKNAEDALSELQATQKQLIQSEKMASLGELTAGIAHEIQNPLNFVNNFSEVSNELIDEMNEELGKGEIEEAKAIAADIKQNLEKINHHGKRADAIVKGMLQHSRRSTNQKELTDINALADEYLRLSYHGLRAKDKSFNAVLNTDYDESIGKINIIPQDVGRVLINLFNNAFYAVTERAKIAGEGYKPTVTLTTQRLNNPSGQENITITVADNGNGIPQEIIDKIFQPFFTTKPTGQGTGLGLSLSYDIIKAHGGEIKVETKEGEGTGFTIQLPAK